MKFAAVFLLTFLSVAARAKTQGITISEKNAPITKIFSSIEKQTDYSFFYSDDLIKRANKISIRVSNASLEKVLQLCFEGQPMTYSIVEHNIVVKEKSAAPKLQVEQISNQPPLNIKGKVLDENKKPIAGASVQIVGTTIGTTSNDEGEFMLSNVPDDAVLKISSVGYETRNFPVNGKENIVASLPVSIQHMGSITVNRGYYTTTEKLNTGNVKKIESQIIERQPVTNPILALQGRVPGLYIAQTNGFAGSMVSLQIRGQNTLTAGRNPLVIVDGVPMTVDPLDRQGNSNAISYVYGGTTPLNSINPNDIESIEVLKDADATSIYGSRGANGVILITTKKAQPGRTKLEVDVNRGKGSLTRHLKMMGLQEYLAIRKQAFANDNVTPNAQNAPDLVLWDQKQGRDWQEEFLGNSSEITDVSAGLTGGDIRNKYNLRGTYHHETTVFPGDFNYKRGGIQFSSENTSANNKFTATTTVMYNADDNLVPGYNPISVRTYAPNLPVYGADGKYYYYNGHNPYAALESKTNSKTNNFNGNITLKFNILPDLVFRASNGYNRTQITNFTTTPLSAADPAMATNEAIYTDNYTQVIITEPQLQYTKAIKDSRFNVLAGGTYQRTEFINPYFIVASDFASDAMLRNIASASTFQYISNASAMYKYASLFARASWDFRGRYVVNASFRRDGSSRFAPENRFGSFGAIGAAWIFSDETFSSSLPWLSFGKLRGSYGTTGNDQTADYTFLETYMANSFAYGSNRGYNPARIYNPYFGWEVTRKLELAAELGFLKNRVMLNVNWFRNRSSNMIAQLPLTPQAGFSSYVGNFDAVVENTGWEADLNAKIIKGSRFSWNTGFNITILKNKLVRLPGIEKSAYRNTYVVGRPLSIIPLYKFTSFKDGIAGFEDINGNGTISSGLADNKAGDQLAAGQRAPKFYGGLDNQLSFSNWQLNVFAQFVKQDGLDYRYAITAFPGAMTNMPVDISTPEFRPTQMVGNASRGYSFYTRSTAMLVDASFIRIKNIALSYSLPEKLTRSAFLKGCRLSVTAQNLFTITSYKGFDPESYSVNLPPLKVINFGIQLNF